MTDPKDGWPLDQRPLACCNRPAVAPGGRGRGGEGRQPLEPAARSRSAKIPQLIGLSRLTACKHSYRKAMRFFVPVRQRHDRIKPCMCACMDAVSRQILLITDNIFGKVVREGISVVALRGREVGHLFRTPPSQPFRFTSGQLKHNSSDHESQSFHSSRQFAVFV